MQISQSPLSFINVKPLLLALILGGLLLSCSNPGETRFNLVPQEVSGIDFENRVESTPEFNIINYLYFYDGGGVSIGDINNDGWPDIFFTANRLPNRLYLNKGNFQFEDVTEKAGVAGTADWSTGTTMADVNGDGLLDIYVSVVDYLGQEGRNQLYINQGDTTFREEAESYGLDFRGYSKQASFFDYDNDGDLDMYLLNHAVHTDESFVRAENRSKYSDEAGDKLFRNDGDVFTEVTRQAGIYSSLIGYGLAATVSDINKDGCQDIYVSNDFHENDYLYLNNCDGTFREVLQESMGHTSRASMGNDIADFNNDGLADIFVVDMLPSEEDILKSAVSSESYDTYSIQRRFGYHPQLIRNTLQLNQGTDSLGNPLFSEIAPLAGVHATDWSWATLFMDMNNDGQKDLFVSNGIYRRPNDLDYLSMVRSDEAQQVLQRGMSDTAMALIDKMPHVKIPNVGFINEGQYRFSRRTEELGFQLPSYSNGAAYGDLDRDGDLDLVVNNVNMPAHIYKNNTLNPDENTSDSGYLAFHLKGEKEGGNRFGIGSKIYFHYGNQHQYYEMMPTRGFLSSVEPMILAGLDTVTTVDSVTVIWPDGRSQVLREVSANQTLELMQSDARHQNHPWLNKGDGLELFHKRKGSYADLFNHEENSFNDFDRQPLAPHMLSTEGPALAVADVNNDGLDDIYAGGAKHQAGTLLIQQDDGTFRRSSEETLGQDRSHEDVGALFFDADGDGSPDLYVVSGGNEYTAGSAPYEDRLYLNDGTGNFVRVPDALPQMRQNGSVVTAADFDGDGDQDLFVGSRSVPRNYGVSPDSYLLENDGKGVFRDVTDRQAEGLGNIGMITDALWEDVNADGYPDLLIVGEWMPITVLLNNGRGRLSNETEAMGLNHTRGWWFALEPGDFDGDGDTDFLAGNLGLNSVLKASEENPLVMYLNDFNGDGQTDPIIAYTQGGKEYPVATRDELLTQFRQLRPKFQTYEDFAGKSVQQIFGERLTEGSTIKRVDTFYSSYIENMGGGSFEVHPLPARAQFAPVFAFSTGDFNGDGLLDAVAGGNFKEVKPLLGGQYDAGYGWFMKGDGQGAFDVHNPLQSGFVVKGQTRDIQQLRTTGGSRLLVVARNDSSLLFYSSEYNQ